VSSSRGDGKGGEPDPTARHRTPRAESDASRSTSTEVHGATDVEGLVLGRYEALRRLASGGMGQVLIARLRGSGLARRFAIKQVHEHLRDDPNALALFRREASIAARLHHPNVVPVLELEDRPDALFLVMDHFPSTSLAHVLREATRRGRSLPIGVCASWGADLALGLHALHELRADDGSPAELVHRDVTPSNVLVGRDGTIKLADFGIARAYADGDVLTAVDQVRGKLGYLPPESLRGQRLDRRADVFSLGVAMWELVARQRLFRAPGLDDAATLHAILHAPIARLDAMRPDCPPELASVVERALERDPTVRLPDAAALAEQLTRFVDGTALRERAELAGVWVAPSIDALETELRAAEARLDARTPPTPKPSTRTRHFSIALVVVAVAVGAAFALGADDPTAGRDETPDSQPPDRVDGVDADHAADNPTAADAHGSRDAELDAAVDAGLDAGAAPDAGVDGGRGGRRGGRRYLRL